MTTLLLSGWTQPVDALAHLEAGAMQFDYSAHGNADAAMEQMTRLNPSRVIGWSMGGQLALRAIMAGAITPKHLTLIAAPIQFVSSSHSPPEGESNRLSDVVGCAISTNLPPTDAQVRIPLPLKGGAGHSVPIPAMDPTTFHLFRESYAKDPARTKTHFHGLVAKGDRDMKRVMGQLSHHPKVEDVAHWLPWLDDLGAQRLGATALASAPPTLIIHGMSDVVVPFAQSEYLARMLPRAQVNGWAEVGHAPHLHDAARLIAEIAAHRAEHGVV